MFTNATYFPFDATLDRMRGTSRPADQQSAGRPFGQASSSARPQLWLPPVDTYETEHAFVIETDLPGVQAEHIELHFEQGTLTISGRRTAVLPHTEQGKLRVYVAERQNGAFARSIRLPDYVDAEKIDATYANGVLTVHVPKAPSARARKIEVRASDDTPRIGAV